MDKKARSFLGEGTETLEEVKGLAQEELEKDGGEPILILLVF